jgi:hypothetical protein
MTDACPVLTESEKKLNDIIGRAETAMMDKVMAALAEAEQAAMAGFHDNTREATPPPLAYFASVLHQKMYCLMCGANLQTMEGGDPRIAIEVIRNSQNIARHYWGADIEPYPREGPLNTV